MSKASGHRRVRNETGGRWISSRCPAFDDGQAPLQVAEKHGLEGMVSKRREAPYRSGACRGWRKIKTTAWRLANRERWRLFERAK